ncbi:cob(I)yrinic acid a,c-diamide adenosyltransferase [Alkalihalophilus marmarensis]|jgi:cob(I)alamin adenosyltransferase|uniref:Cobinamide adenolsyltransferase n=1 Tax=Alkalihalophilus marmarensis DSM 21297 TaxID=1188261 RepID=U6SN07_9BACI|nr:cob(I)yrinic acid a,c-diamide adenosyltransferase [Alkalihalophilus marmarensis]ERN52973.1 cobinamide adenolsyltransferase [Alkalihalophilus marmarensis DSM 21297]MCM3488969.1 cob(I)yrinic acid a,c-diamide adenosyltransferase [Alkalihalophilus marmarensis]
MSQQKKRRGLTLVYTGDGKGKTTSSLGLALRGIGRGFNVGIFQFIKSKERTYGEEIALKKLGVEMIQLGVGFTWTKTPEEHREALRKAWPIAREAVMSGEYDLVILDELNNALAIDKFPIEDVLPIKEVIDLIQHKPSHVHLVVTGRSAKDEIKNIADLVSVIEPEKHYYNEGVPAVKGIEF